MDYLTTKQLDDFNNPLAFSRARTAPVGRTELGRSETSPIKTGNMEESYKLVQGAAKRLETLRGNLDTMLDLAKKGSQAGGNQRKLDEAYGKIRSLTAGFDQVVEKIRFNKQPVFTDRPVELSMDVGRSIELDPIRLLTYGEDSLNLSESLPSAKVGINFDVDDQIINEGVDIIGLDLTGGSFNPSANPALELEDGIYKVGIEYAGADSAVSISTREGQLIERKEGVDLSGSGSQWVDFDQGVRLNFEMESFFQSFDKYDFENNGPANLSATMTYERIERQLIRTEEGPPQTAGAELLFDNELRIGEGSLRVSEPEVAPVSPDAQALDSGNYNIEIEYHGEDSIVRLKDSFGRIKAYEFGVDLSQQGSNKVDFGNGLSFQVENDQFTSLGAQYSTNVKYTAESRGIEDFSFRDYQKRIEEAITVIEEQQEIIAETQTKIEETNQLRNQASTGGAPTSGVMNAGSALNVLSGGGGAGIFASISPEARFGMASEQIFQTTTALPTQANQSPEALAQLSGSGTASSLLSNFA
ncbi:MAG: hypothetical protein ACLFU4_05270 [Opitutales bacterium]